MDTVKLISEEIQDVEYITEQKSTPSRLKDLKPSLDKTSVSNEILKEIESLDAPSLLAQAEPSKETETEPTEDNSSLLERKI